MAANSHIVSGAGMFLNFVTVLAEEVRKAGGSDWMLYFAQRKHAQPMMALLAKVIVESKLWRIPKSMIMAEIERSRRSDFDRQFLERDKDMSWITYSPTADSLTELRFSVNKGITGPEITWGIPDEIRDQRFRVCGDVITYQGQRWAVTYFEEDGSAIFLAPDVFDLES